MSYKRSFVLGGLILWFSLMATQFASPVSAQVPEINNYLENWQHATGWAIWAAKVDFDGGGPRGTMRIVIGHEDVSGKKIVDFAETFDIECHDVGSVTYTDSSLVLDGAGYVDCELYNFKDTVYEITQGALVLPDDCYCYNPYAYITATPAAKDGMANPVAYTDAGMVIEMPVSYTWPSNGTRLAIEMQGYRFETDDFPVPQKPQTFYGQVLTQNGVSTPYFKTISGTLFASTSPSYGTPMMSTNTSQLTIGFNPTTGDLMIGEVKDVEVDPFLMPRCCGG